MRLLSSPLATLIATVLVSALPVSGEEQCGGGAPMKSVSTYLGATLDYEVADRICCNNHRFAEYRGYLDAPEVDLFSRLDPNGETIFYDSVCGIPLFVAPRGRTFEEFREESSHHGWPSFRPEEIVSENVILHSDGRMESKCGTHLGHNLPSGGIDRYCIDLVCIAGTPFEEEKSSGGNLVPGGTLSGTDFDADTYTSSAEEFSGNYSKTGERIKLAAIIVGSVVAAVILGLLIRKAWRRGTAASLPVQEKAADSQLRALQGGDEDSRSSGTESTGRQDK